MYENREDGIRQVYHKWRRCEDCSLCQFRGGSMLFGVGDVARAGSGVVIVVDKASPEATREGVFMHPSGGVREVLTDLLCGALEMDIDDFWITPAVACPTTKEDPNDWRQLELVPGPKQPHINACKARIFEEIEILRPEVVVAMGGPALKVFFPGSAVKPEFNMGQILPGVVYAGMAHYPVPVMVTHSPTELHRNRDEHDDSGRWKQTYDHLKDAISVAQYVRKQRNG